MNDKKLLGCMIIAAIVGIGAYGVYQEINHQQVFQEQMKLSTGKITVFQYCSHIGKAAVDDPQCKTFNLLYGPQP